MRKSKSFVLILAICISFSLLLPVTALPQESSSDEVDFAFPLSEPEQAVKLANILDRQLIFAYVSQGCSYCQKLKEETLQSEAVAQLIKSHFVFSFIGLDKKEEITLPFPNFREITQIEPAARTGFRGTPHTVMLYPDLSGRPLAIRGYRQAEPFRRRLIYFSKFDRKMVSFYRFTDGENPKLEAEYYNYRREIKEISPEELETLRKAGVDIPLLEEKPPEELPEGEEMILNLPDPEQASQLARQLLEKGVQKVFVVK